MKNKQNLLLLAMMSVFFQLHGQGKNGKRTDENEQIAIALADLQLKGYNDRNIEVFLSAYSDSVEVYGFPDTLWYTGKEEMRARYTDRFDSTPDLHCEIINRVVFGNQVIDHEKVTINRGEPIVNAVAIYQVSNGKIQKVWFLPKD